MRACRISALFVAGVVCAASVAAQQSEQRGRGGGGRGAVLVAPGVGFQITEAAPLEITSVKDAPFSAQAVTELTQILGDGNRIERRFESSVARDSHGRIRREEEIALVGPFAATGADAPRLVTIADPDSGVSYTLDENRRLAYRSRAADVVKQEELRKLAKKLERVNTEVATRKSEVGRVVTENLGSRTVEGLKAQGTRTTTTIPAGVIGNVLPIAIVSERWFSPELQMPILITRRDPRVGDSVYRLSNVLRAEPPDYWFTVPPTYEVKDGTLNFKVLDVEKAKKLKAAEALPKK